MRRPDETVLCLDLETRSLADLRRGGAYPYAEHPSTRVLCAVFGFRGPAGTWVHVLREGAPLPAEVREHVDAGGDVLAWNAGFEAALWERCLAPLWGPPPAPEQWNDVAALAQAYSLPASLEAACEAVGTDVRKDTEGAALMRRLCDASTPEPTPAELARLAEYCATDVLATLDCNEQLPAWPPGERDVLAVDRAINARGVRIDLQLAAAMHERATQRAAELDVEVLCATLDLGSATSTPTLKAWLGEQGIQLARAKRVRADGRVEETETLDRDAVTALLQRDDLPDVVRTVLMARAEATRATSLTKLARAAEMVSLDGRARNLLRYCGAHTGRWTSSGLQVHNMPRNGLGKIVPGLDDAVLDALHADTALPEGVDTLTALSQSLRAILRAAPGCELIGADYSAIEARVLAWLAREEGTLSAFREGRDIYVEDAAAVGSDNRQLGKVCRLANGYGMGPVKFARTAAKAGVQLSYKDARRIQQRWRIANSDIVAFWYDLEEAFALAIREPGSYQVGRITVVGASRSVRIVLPSGRPLLYWRPKARTATRRVEVLDENDNVVTREVTREELCYFIGEARGMALDSTYGGKLAENVTQAVARDLLAHTLVRLRNTHYANVVLHVHDSLASEVPAGTGSVTEYERLITALPAWADGLPLTASGYRSEHFKG